MTKDVIIIGGGIGGLVTGCLLSNEGYKVTVLERHSRIGGGLHCFDRYGKTFETGIHYVSGFQNGGVLRKIFTYLGIIDDLQIMPLDKNGFDLLHVASDNITYPIGVGRENYIQLLVQKFPEEEGNIRRYMDAIYDLCDQVPLYNLRTSNNNLAYFQENFLVSVGAFVDSYTSNEKLKHVLVWDNSLYAGEKDTSPIYIHALVTKFYIEGASRFVGGSQQLADGMTNFIRSHGGEVLSSSGVSKIDVQDRKIRRVITSDGREFSAEYYISDIHPASLLSMIDPAQVQKSYRERLQNLDNTYSVFTVYISLKPDTFRFLNHNYYYYKDYETIWNAIRFDPNDGPPGFMLTTPPAPDQGEYADKVLINCMMNFDAVRKWENTTLGKRGNEYIAFKKDFENKIIDLVEKVFPSFRDCIEHIFSATPLTVRDYLGTKDGSLYGYKKDCRNIMKTHIMPRTKVENLLLTGQNINLHGIIGVPLSAIVTAGELVGLEYLVNKINKSNNFSNN